MSDDGMRQLLSDAVSDIDPNDRLAEIRASVRPDPKVVPMSHHGRPWRYAAAGIVATAAVIGVVAYLTSVAGDDPTELGPASHGDGTGPTHPTTITATDTAVATPKNGNGTDATTWRPAAIYYLGHGPKGTVLYREFSPAPPGTAPLEYAVEGLMTDPVDPDYRTPWRQGWLDSATASAGVIRVVVGTAPASRPASMSSRDASEAVQQVIYTVQAAVQRRDAVQFVRNDAPAASVLGVATGQPLSQGQAIKVLSLMNVTDPVDGVHVPRGRLTVTGVNNGFEGTVVVRLVRQGKTVLTKPGIASGSMDPNRLFPWRLRLDTSSLAPGRYTLVASNDDPSGQNQAASDTRTIYLR
jgi:hypothetical protein